jgi:hypothetical protein
LAQPDLQHPLAWQVQGIEAGRQVPFERIPELIVIMEELFVITAEAFPEPADQGVPAGMVLPEILDRPLIHQWRTNPEDTALPRALSRARITAEQSCDDNGFTAGDVAET